MSSSRRAAPSPRFSPSTSSSKAAPASARSSSTTPASSCDLRAERQRPDGQRLPEYSEARLPTLERKLFSAIADLSGRRDCPADRLARLCRWIGWARPTRSFRPRWPGRRRQASAEALVRGFEAGRRDSSPCARGRRAQSAVADEHRSDDSLGARHRSCSAGGASALRRHHSRAGAPGVRADRAGHVRRAAGRAVYPDATSSLRLTYGTVKGYTEEDGTPVAPFTRLGQACTRGRRLSRERSPYVLPTRWLQRKIEPRSEAAAQLRQHARYRRRQQRIAGGQPVRRAGRPGLRREYPVAACVFRLRCRTEPDHQRRRAGDPRRASDHLRCRRAGRRNRRRAMPSTR